LEFTATRKASFLTVLHRIAVLIQAFSKKLEPEFYQEFLSGLGGAKDDYGT
jgi:hypothetical protein